MYWIGYRFRYRISLMCPVYVIAARFASLETPRFLRRRAKRLRSSPRSGGSRQRNIRVQSKRQSAYKSQASRLVEQSVCERRGGQINDIAWISRFQIHASSYTDLLLPILTNQLTLIFTAQLILPLLSHMYRAHYSN